MANTSPRRYSLLNSARRSWAKYSSGVRKLFRTVDMSFPPGGIAGVESVSKSRILALHSSVSALLSPFLLQRFRLCRSLARGIELQEFVQRGKCTVGFLVLVQPFGLIQPLRRCFLVFDFDKGVDLLVSAPGRFHHLVAGRVMLL